MSGSFGVAGMFVLAFAVGLTGALVPGPTLVATVGAAVRRGWSAGALVTSGHMMVEALICLAVIAGAGAVTGSWTELIAIAGGGALIIFGGLTVHQSRHATLSLEGEGWGGNAAAAGVITSAANPYFWIWWLSVGSALLLAGLREGLVVAIAFVAGHWSADLGWYTLVAGGIDRGRRIITPAWYRRILRACGIFLIGFGVWFLLSAGEMLVQRGMVIW